MNGILIGLVAGVGLSAAVAVWVARMPSPFQNRALDNAPETPLAAPARSTGSATANVPAAATAERSPPAAADGGTAATAAPPATASGTRNGGNGKADSAAAGEGGNAATAESAAPTAARAGEGGAAAFIQVGAYSSEEDAQRQVEAVALATGTRATVQAAQQNGRPVYRVRLGPYTSMTETAELMDALKANGISTALVRSPAGAR